MLIYVPMAEYGVLETQRRSAQPLSKRSRHPGRFIFHMEEGQGIAPSRRQTCHRGSNSGRLLKSQYLPNGPVGGTRTHNVSRVAGFKPVASQPISPLPVVVGAAGVEPA